MVKIYLARHGQNVDNVNGILNGHRDEPLTDLGLEQANTTAHLIKNSDVSLDKIYTSPLQRAQQTAGIIAQELGLEKPEVLQRLIERDFGVMTGRPATEISALCYPEIIVANPITYFLSPAGAETFPTLIERGKKVIAEIQAANKTGSVLLVTHGDIGKMIYAAYYDLDWKEVLINFHFGNGEVLQLTEDSLAAEAHLFKQPQHNQ